MQPAELIRIIDQLNQANNILILAPPAANADDLAAALALQAFLIKLDKEVAVISPGAVSDKYSFLPKFEGIKSDLAVTKNFVIELSTKRVQIERVPDKQMFVPLVIVGLLLLALELVLSHGRLRRLP